MTEGLTATELDGLRRIRRRRAALWIALFGVIVVVPVAGAIHPKGALWAVAACVLSVIVIHGLVKWSRCPKCREYFHLGVLGAPGSGLDLFSRRCRSCGLDAYPFRVP